MADHKLRLISSGEGSADSMPLCEKTSRNLIRATFENKRDQHSISHLPGLRVQSKDVPA